jgi:ATP-binding cassette subfamily F protein 3
MYFGERALFDDVSHTVGPHDRVGLVGSNGTGKSTLLKIIAGIQQPEEGRIDKAAYITVGYLPQDGVIASGKTLYEEGESAFEDIMEVQKEISEIQEKLGTIDPSDPEYGELLEVFGELQHKLEDLDAFRLKSKVERVLMGLGFSTGDMGRQADEFSGGWQMRIALAKLLLREPSVLLLDEPTNHLDIESLQWLEGYLRAYNGAVILVSHDRQFLDNLTSKTLAIRLGRLEVYSGNYSFYETEKEIRKAQQVHAARNQQRQIDQTEKFIERFRYKATKARQVQSRVKMLEKIERVELDDDEEEIHFHFPPPPPSGAVVMQLREIDKAYGPKTIFSRMSYTIERGDRIAIVGPNGAGKSTFSRILAGAEPFDSGERITGHNVVVSYFAQHQAEELDPSKEALQIIDEVATGEIRTKLRTLLGAFLFHGDDAFKKVRILSGGEKSRLALAKMLLQPSNFLIMDEPTNHLDMRSKKVLQDALAEFEGTFVIVSHDRAFLDPLVTKVIEFTPGTIRSFPGNLSEYLAKKQDEEREGRNGGQQPADGTRKQQLSERNRNRMEAEQRQSLSKKLKPLKKELSRVEGDIEAFEARKSGLETSMADPGFYGSPETARELTLEYGIVRQRLDSAYAEWARLTEEIAETERTHAT